MTYTDLSTVKHNSITDTLVTSHVSTNKNGVLSAVCNSDADQHAADNNAVFTPAYSHSTDVSRIGYYGSMLTELQ